MPDLIRSARTRIPRPWALVLGLGLLTSPLAAQAPEPSAPPAQPPAAPTDASLAISVQRGSEEAVLSYFNRPIVVLRAEIMGRSPAERVALAVRALDDIVASGRIEPVDIVPVTGGVLIGVGRHVITGLTDADLEPAGTETVAAVAEETAERTRRALAEAAEARQPVVWVRGAVLTVAAIILALGVLWGLGRIRRAAENRLAALADSALARSGLDDQYSARVSALLRGVQNRLIAIASLVLQAVVLYGLLTFTLRRFPYTRPWGESLRESMLATLSGIGLGMLRAVPSLFTVLVIFAIARVVTLLVQPWFAAVESGVVTMRWIHAETAATTRRLVNAGVWLFAVAMAFPYVPGSDTDAFRGISVAVGLMVTLGSSGIVNQVMSGFVLTYSRAIRLGDFVRIGEVEGNIAHVGMLSTKIRTLRSEEVTIPNAVVVSQTTTDYSRFATEVLTPVVITVGYNVPWRQVHALLGLAAERTPGVRQEPKPRVLQLALEDMRVQYTLLICLERQQWRAVVLSALHANILDLFNEYGVQIVTPNYEADPPEPKVVPKSDWFAAPARPDEPVAEIAERTR